MWQRLKKTNLYEREYTLIVPALERKGPVNVAVDIGLAASAAGWMVRILYLSSVSPREDLDFATEVRQFRLSDLWRLRGVVHTHCLRPDLLGLLLRWNRKIALVTTIHNIFRVDLGFTKKQFYIEASWQIWKRSLRGYDLVICISKTMQQYYAKEISGIQFQVVYNFRSPMRGQLSKKETLEWIKNQKCANNFVLSFVGELSELKNIHNLVKAISCAPSLSLLICGEGVIRESLDALVIRYGLSDRVRFEGQVPSPTAVIRHTDALILPSYIEGFPLVVIEAASVGVPSLLSDIAVHRELSNLGFGQTFDHLHFSNLEDSVRSLCQATPAPSSMLMELWSKEFLPEVGFKNYEALIVPILARK